MTKKYLISRNFLSIITYFMLVGISYAIPDNCVDLCNKRNTKESCERLGRESGGRYCEWEANSSKCLPNEACKRCVQSDGSDCNSTSKDTPVSH